MRTYFRLFIGLLTPLGGLFIVVSVLYFKIEYNFTQAMRLGVLFGFFIAIGVSLFTAFVLSIMRLGKTPQKDIFSGVRKLRKKEQHKNNMPKTTQTPQTDTPLEHSFLKKTVPVEQHIILLMDSTMAFEVLLYAITDLKIGKISEIKESEGYLFIKTENSIIRVHISPLTKHTSQMQINSENNDIENMQKIVTYIKDKEYSFTQD